eukprot:SAG11_NODE_258_length_11542_cov_35.970899_6_plen_73_part_00
MRSQAGLLESLIAHTRGRIQHEKDTIGFNVAGLKHVQQEMEDEGILFFDDQVTIAAARSRGTTAKEKKKRLV